MTYLTTKEVAKLLRIGIPTVWLWCEKKNLPHIKIGRKKKLFEEQAVMKWIREQDRLAKEKKRKEQGK